MAKLKNFMKRTALLLMLISTVLIGSAFTTTEKVATTRQCSDWEQTGNITVNWLTGQQMMQYRRLCCSGAPTMWCDYEYENRPLND